MRLIKVSELPKRTYHDLQRMFDEFIESSSDVAMIELEDDDYSNILSAYKSIWEGIGRSKHAGIKIHIRKDKLYLTKEK